MVVVVGGARTREGGAICVPQTTRGGRGSVLTNDVRWPLQFDGGDTVERGVEVVVVVGGACTQGRGDLGPLRKTVWWGSVLANGVRGVPRFGGETLRSGIG
jgi:hypothetical protein